MITIATLDDVELPVQFSYQPVSPQKRLNLVQTEGAVIIQKANEIVAADTLLAWNCSASCLADWKFFFNLYNDASHPSYAFTGYWGEVFTVKFHTLDPAKVRARVFDISGSFHIVGVTSWGG